MILRLCVAALLLLPSAALAQGNVGPFGGLFGRTPERIGREYTVFEVRTSGSVQVEDALMNESAGQLDRGAASGVSGSINFEKKTDYLDFRARSSATYVQLMQSPAVGWTTTDTGFAVLGKLGSRLSVEATAMHFYSPFFTFQPVLFMAPGGNSLPTPTTVVSAAGLIENHTLDGRFSLVSQYAKHSNLRGFVSVRDTRFLQRRDQDQRLTGYGAEWRRQVSRGFGLRLGYTRETVRERGRPDEEFIHEWLDLGLDFYRTLSLSRRTTVWFNTQTSMLTKEGTGRHYRLNGQATLTTMFKRSWQFLLSGQRTTEFIPGFTAPLNADTASAGINGLLSRRAQLVLNFTGGMGQFGYEEDLGRFRTAYASTQFNFALTRKLGVFAQHGMYFTEYPRSASALAVMSDFSRQSFVVGITAWIPIISPSEASSDSR